MRVNNVVDYSPQIRSVNGQGYNEKVVPDKKSDFKDIFRGILAEARNLREMDIENNTLLSAGGMDNLDSIMIDMEKADIALQFTLQVRNKILDAYQEIMRMQV